MLTQKRLQEVLRYDPKTGEFFWRVQPGLRADLVGKRAGGPHIEGYLRIAVDDKRYLSHRLAWLYVHGAFPKGQLDHKNRQRTDNRITNLRLATNGQNNANSIANSRNRSGLKGAHWYSPYNKWHSQIQHEGKRHFLGYFTTAEEAHTAYCKAAEKLHGEFFYSGATG